MFKKIFILCALFQIASCGEFIGFDDFEEADIGAAERIEVSFTEDNLVKFYDTVDRSMENYVPCAVAFSGKVSAGWMKVRGG